ARSIACPLRSNGFLITAAATSPATPAASPATSGSNRGRRLSKVHRATEWLKPSFARSSATMSASVRDQKPKPSCVSCQLGSPTTTLLHAAHPSMSLMQIDLGLDWDVLRGPIGDCGHGRQGVWRPQLREPNA